MHDGELFDALSTLRGAPHPDAPELAPSWRVVLIALDRMGRSVGGGMAVDREDTRTEAFIKVRRNIHTLEAQDPASAWAWVKRIYHHTQLDSIRRRRSRREVYDEDAASERGSRGSYIDRIPASEPHPDPAQLDPKELAPFEDALFDRVDAYLAIHVRSATARANARRRAELAYESIIRQRPTEDLIAAAGGGIKTATFYQWVRRGREDTLLPVLERWMEETSPKKHEEDSREAAEHRFARALTAILRSRQRADAGKARPKRRKGES